VVGAELPPDLAGPRYCQATSSCRPAAPKLPQLGACGRPAAPRYRLATACIPPGDGPDVAQLPSSYRPATAQLPPRSRLSTASFDVNVEQMPTSAVARRKRPPLPASETFPSCAPLPPAASGSRPPTAHQAPSCL